MSPVTKEAGEGAGHEQRSPFVRVVPPVVDSERQPPLVQLHIRDSRTTRILPLVLGGFAIGLCIVGIFAAGARWQLWMLTQY